MFRKERVLEIIVYIKLVGILYRWFTLKEKAKEYVTSLPTMSVLKFILSDANFYLSYEKLTIAKFETVL